MGLAQSHAELFSHEPLTLSDGEPIDPIQLLYRVERTLWRREPAWLKPLPREQRKRSNANERPSSDQRLVTAEAIDPMSPMSPSQAMELLPSLMDEKWVAALVSLADSMDAVIQTSVLAVLARVIRSDAAESVFLKVCGVEKLMQLIKSESMNIRYLSLEVIFAICSRNAKMIENFSEHGLVHYLAALISQPITSESDSQIIIAALKTLRLSLPNNIVKSMVGSCGLLPTLLKLAHASQSRIVSLAVICIGHTLPNSNNISEIAQLGCIEALLKLMIPANAQSHVIIEALSVIADQDVTIFPKELTVMAMTKTLDTLRGGAKRSRIASATAYLFANLIEAPVFRSGLCTEQNLSILSKLLVGGSVEVLHASTFALGVAAFTADHNVKETLFAVDAPMNLLKVLDVSDDNDLIQLVLFAISSMLDETILLPSGVHVAPSKINNTSASLRQKMEMLSSIILMKGNAIRDVVFRYSTEVLASSSSFAAKILSSLSATKDVKSIIIEDHGCTRQMLLYLKDASELFLPTLILFFIECSEPMPPGGEIFCDRLSVASSNLVEFTDLLTFHEPTSLLGLMVAFANFALGSNALRGVLCGQDILERIVALLSKANQELLHAQILHFLDCITQEKNGKAIAGVYSCGTDRLANLLHSPLREMLFPTMTVLRRVFKYHNNPDVPSPTARRQLLNLIANEDTELAIIAARTWGNLLQFSDKRQSLAAISNAAEILLRLLVRSHRELIFSRDTARSKACCLVIRTVSRAVSNCDDMKAEVASASSFLSIFELFNDPDERIMGFSVEAMIHIAQVQSLRRYMVVPKVLETLSRLLRDRESPGINPTYRIAWLKFVGTLGKRDPSIQKLLAEFRVIDAILLLVHSPVVVLDQNVLKEAIESLAWLCTGDTSVRRLIASASKLVDIALKYSESSREPLVAACLHLLQRLTIDDGPEDLKNKIRQSGGVPLIMRAVLASVTPGPIGDILKQRAFALVRNLVRGNEANKLEFKGLGFNPSVVSLITNRDLVGQTKLLVRALQALAAMCYGTTSASKENKREVLQCDHSNDLLQLVTDKKEPKLCFAWCDALANAAHASPQNQKKIVDLRMTSVIVGFLVSKEGSQLPLQVAAARLLSSLASFPANRSPMMEESGEHLPMGMSLGLQSESHELQRYTALLAAHLATRHVENKTRIGASSVPMHLVDRLSSKQLNVLENVMQAVAKLGGHAGNKVKIGSKVCFEKLLSLVHHDELAIRKGAISAIAVLIEGNVVNKKHLLSCEASVVPELCALMKSPNGKIVESAMLILGELSQLHDQILEVSKYIDIVAIVRMIGHVNARIRRAALITVVNLTKESFNKLRFGIHECLDALISCLKSEDMLIVELATTSLANLSFVDTNVTKITNHEGSLVILLKLAAVSTSSKDYLSWNEARSLGLGGDPSTKNASPKSKSSPIKMNIQAPADREGDEEGEDEEEIDDMLEPFVYSSHQVQDRENDHDDDGALLDFSSFPARQTAVLEQTLLVISNCSEAYHSLEVVEKVAIKVISQALNHPSELVKRCSCYILAVWCKKDAKNQRITTKQANLPRSIQLLKSPNLNIVESVLYLLAKLAYYGDNHVKLLQLDLVTTLVQSILRRAANLTHEGLIDRAIRLLGTLVQYPKVRQSVKSEEIIADVLTQLLQIHRGLAKNTSRLIIGMLEEESLKFFLPKKTVVILRVLLTDKTTTSLKSIRNILCIFQRIAVVEEHKTTIALEDSGETLSRMIQELCPVAEPSDLQTLPPNASTVLNLLACIAGTRKIAMILHEKDVYKVLPLYIMTVDIGISSAENQVPDPSLNLLATPEMALDALIIARHLCSILNDRAGTRLSSADFTRHIVHLLRIQRKPAGQVFQLSVQSHEAFRVLDLLSSYSRDQQTLVEEDAVEVMNRYLQRWVESAELDGTVQGREELATGGPSLDLLEYVGPVIRVIAKMAAHDVSKVFLVREGTIPLLLQSLSIRILTDDQRLGLARTLKLLCAVPTAPADCFDTQDVVLPLFRFSFTNRHREDLLLLCLACMADILETSVSSRQHVVGQSQVLDFLLECLEDVRESTSDKVHYAINALECLSMEPELAIALSKLDSHKLRHVSKLLLASEDILGRPTQYFAVEMIGYMASYGFAHKMGLQREMISRIISFLDFEGDANVTGESIALALWTLGHLVRSEAHISSEKSTVAVTSLVPQWIAESIENIVKIINAGLRESEHLGTTSLSIANALMVLLAVVDLPTSQDIVRDLIKRCRRLCTTTAVHLEAVEREVSLPALHLLCILLTNQYFEHIDDNNGCDEDWSAVFRHLMEWMEVYARDPAHCPTPSLSDAFSCLGQITTIRALVPEFRACINRSGLADIACNTVVFLDPQRTCDTQDSAKVGSEQHLVLSNALKVCGNLMEHTSAYSERFFLANLPQSIENILMVDDDELIMECLICMSLLADWSSSRQLLFSSLRCVRRLTILLAHQDLNIVAKVTPLLGLMCSRIPSLPGLCSMEGIKALCDRLTEVHEWSNRDRYITRISDDCAAMLLSLFSAEEGVYKIFEEVDVARKMFDIVSKHNAPEIPLRILTKISSCQSSHVRLLKLLEPMSSLLQGVGVQLGNTAQHLVLCVFFNLFCRADEGEHLTLVLRHGESTVLRQMLPLGRWLDVPNAATVRIVLKILHTYLSDPTYKTLLNDGKNISALLRLVSDSSDEVSVAAAQLLLLAINEREVEIAVTVEDGIAVLVRTLQKTSKWNLQCLLLSILRAMCHDNEVPVLIVNEDGVSRLVHFVRERKNVLFAADERLALSCKILRYVSAAPTAGAASRIVEARGHLRLIDLLTHQESSVTSDSDRALTMEILTNIATSKDVAPQLADSKLHDYCMKWILQNRQKEVEQDRGSLSTSQRLAVWCLQSICKHSKTARQDVSTTSMPIVELLEGLLPVDTIDSGEHARSRQGMSLCALSILMHISKLRTGRHMINLQSSPKFIQRVVVATLSDAALQLGDKPSNIEFENGGSKRLGLKLLGHLLGDTSPDQCHVEWALDDMIKLSSLFEATLGDHQHKKMQLYTLNAVGGAFRGGFYFSISTEMLGNLINLLLIIPSPQHAQEAEYIIIKAFEREEIIYRAICENQILEQLLIVFCQRAESRQMSTTSGPLSSSVRPLSGVLTHVLKVSMSRGLTVHQRFISKVITLLGTSSIAGKAEEILARGPDTACFDNPEAWASVGSDEDMLARSLAEYLGFVYHSMSVSTVSSSVATKNAICDALRTEANSLSLTVILLLMLSTHQRICPKRSEAASEAKTQQSELLIWHILSDSLDIRSEDITIGPSHIARLIKAVPGNTWLCLLSDLFSELEVTSADQVGAVSPVQATIDSLRVLSVVARHSKPEDEGAQRLRGVVLIQSLTAMVIRPSSAIMCSALRAISDARTGWGDDMVVQACRAFGDMVRLIPLWLALFRDTEAGDDEARVLLLQLLLLLVSSGSYTEELKNAGIRDAIESNALIPAAHKSLAISILSLLGYNADLNVEFEQGLERFEQASSPSTKNDTLGYLVNFLQLYTLTDEPLQARAIDCFMRHLIDGTTAVSREVELTNESDHSTLLRINNLLFCLGKLSTSRCFVELFKEQWNLNALLLVCFSRRRALENNKGYKECSVLNAQHVGDILDIASRLCGASVPTAVPVPACSSSFGALSDTVFINAMTFLDDMKGKEDTVLCERVIAVFTWTLENEDTFDIMSRYACRLRSALRFVAVMSDDGARSLLIILDTLTRRVSQIELLSELLTELLTAVYRLASKLKNSVREKLLLCILVILKRMGEDDLTACSVYEQSIQVILANVHVPAEMAARCSWDLLAVLTELDAAVVTIFNFDGIQIMLKEFTGPTSAARPDSSPKESGNGVRSGDTSPMKRILSTRKSALSAADRAALAAASAVSNEVTYRRMEALKCLSKAARSRDEVLLKIGEAPGIGAHLFRVLAGNSGGAAADHDSSPVATSVNQEHAAHLIARVSSQEFFRASLLSQDHISTLIESLESVHPKIVLFALEALFYLSEFPMCLDALVRHATVPVLAQILVSPLVEESEHTQHMTELFVLGLLANMCAKKNKVICRRVVSSHLLPRLRGYAQLSSRPQIQFYAVWIIKSVSKDSELVAKLHEHCMLDVLSERLGSMEPIRTQRKTFGALCCMISGYRPGMAFVDADGMRRLVRHVVLSMHPLVVMAHPHAHKSLARALTVLEAVASLSQVEKDLLSDEIGEEPEARAIPLVVQLLESIHADVKLRALLVITRWVEDNVDRLKLRVQMNETALRSLASAVSEERGDCLLVALVLLHTLLVVDEEIKNKLSAMTNDVLLRLLPILINGGSPSTQQLRSLNEALKSLVAMTRAGAKPTANTTAAALSGALDPLVELLRLSAATDNLRLNALYLLVTFAGSSMEFRPRMVANGTMLECVRMLQEPHDDKLLQLCLLGIALLTGAGVEFSSAVPSLLDVLDVLLACLQSRNASVQANAVWVVSNICEEERLKAAIVNRGGAMTLQAVLNETLSAHGDNAGPNSTGSATQARPASSSQRIREYAPKAIKSLGFAPMLPSKPST